jgi:hypothetical protein
MQTHLINPTLGGTIRNHTKIQKKLDPIELN